MADDSRNDDAPSERMTKEITVRFKAEAWERIEEAARVKTAREHTAYTVTDVIRGGASMNADKILAEAGSAAA